MNTEKAAKILDSMAKTTPKRPTNGQTGVIEMPPVENSEPVPQETAEPIPADDTLPAGTVIDETASKEQLDRTTGQRGQRKESGLGFFARLPKYPPSDWERLKLYLYRLAPITDRTAGGNPVKFLTIYREAIDEEMVLKEWGSGKYRCLLNRMQEKGESIPIDRVEFEIENLNFPPKVPPGEWVDDPRNRRWAWGNEKENAAAKAATPATPPPPTGPTLGEIVTAVKGIADMTRANQPTPPAKEESPFAKIDIVGLMEKTQAANNPSAILAAAKEIAAIAKPEKSGDSELLLKLIDKLIPATNAAAAPVVNDPVAQLKTYAEMAKTMREAFGPGEKESEAVAQSRMNGWQEFTNGIVSAVAPGLNKMAEIFGTFMVMKMQMDLRNQQAQPGQQPQPRPAAPAIQPVQQPLQPNPQAQPAPAAAPEQSQAQPEQQMNPQQAEMQMRIHAALSAIDYAMPTLMDHLNMNPEDIDVPRGVLFAEWFWAAKLPTRLPLQPLIVGAELLKGLKQFPPEVLAQIIQSNAPAMYEALVPTPDKAETLLGFIKEFLSYDPEAEEPNGGKK